VKVKRREDRRCKNAASVLFSAQGEEEGKVTFVDAGERGEKPEFVAKGGAKNGGEGKSRSGPYRNIEGGKQEME